MKNSIKYILERFNFDLRRKSLHEQADDPISRNLHPSGQGENTNHYRRRSLDWRYLTKVDGNVRLSLRNDDPWNWSYQWTYACWSQNDLSVVPHKNLVSNIGIGPDASNTKSDKRVPFFPERMESIEFPLVYPTIKRDKGFESRYRQKEGPTITRQFKNYLKTLPHKLHGFFKRQEDTRRTADNTFNRKFNGSESSKNIIGIINTQQK